MGVEKTKFYNNIKRVTVEARMTDVHVYGQGKYIVSTEGLAKSKEKGYKYANSNSR